MLIGERHPSRFATRASGVEQEDGTPAAPHTFRTAVTNWKPGDVIPLPPGRGLRVVATVAGASEDEDPVLVVEPA